MLNEISPQSLDVERVLYFIFMDTSNVAKAYKLQVLVITDVGAVEESEVMLAMSRLAGAQDFILVTQTHSQILNGDTLPIEFAGAFDYVFALYNNADLIGDEFHIQIHAVLKPGGKILVQTNEYNMPNLTIERKLVMQGFTEVEALDVELLSSFKAAQSYTAKKATWRVGSSYAIKRSVNTIGNVQICDELDIIDEESLLTDEDRKKPQLPTVRDCEIGSTRRACKNCTCGRAETEKNASKLGFTDDQINNPQSACGNCGLGDAFRCNGCPYRGLPPFKLGEKVQLPADFLVSEL